MYGSEKLVFGRQPMIIQAVMCSRPSVISWYPHDVGRDSWVWGEQGTLEMMISPYEVGDDVLIERRPLSGGNGVALG